MRTHAWAEHELGEILYWPQSLRTTLMLMLDSRQPMCLAWGPRLTFFYNDTYAPMLGKRHPDALGCSLQDVWSDVWSDIAPLVARAVAGESVWYEDFYLVVDRNGYPEDTWWSFSYSPVRDDSGAMVGMLNVCTDTTAKVLADRRQTFQLGLEARLRNVSDPAAVMSTAVDALGRHLGVQRVGYGRVKDDETTVVLESCFADGVQILEGEFSLDSFGPESIAMQRAGVTKVCDDIFTDPDQDPAVWAAIDTRAFVSVPLIRDGRFRASLYVNADAPRRWSTDDVVLITDVAARTWDAVGRARADRRAAAEQERQRQMLMQMPGFAAVMTGPDHRFEFVNDAYVEVAGRTDIVGRNVRDVFPELAGQGFYELLDQVYATGEAFIANNMPIRLGNSDETRFISFVYQPTRDDKARVNGIFVGGYEVTGSHRAHEALRASEARLRDLNTNLERQVLERAREHGQTWQVSPDLLSVMNSEAMFERVNPAWTTTLGWSAEHMLRTPYLEFVHPDDIARSVDAFERVKLGDPVLRFENRYHHVDDTWRWLSWVAVPVGGKFYCSARDITAEKSAAAERDQLWTLSEDMLARADYSGKMSAVNPAWTNVLGWSERELLTNPYAQIIHPDDVPVTVAALGDMGRTGQPTRFENRIKTSTGDWKPVGWTVSPEPGSVNFIAVGRDLTDYKEREAELIRAQEALRQSRSLRRWAS